MQNVFGSEMCNTFNEEICVSYVAWSKTSDWCNRRGSIASCLSLVSGDWQSFATAGGKLINGLGRLGSDAVPERLRDRRPFPSTSGVRGSASIQFPDRSLSARHVLPAQLNRPPPYRTATTRPAPPRTERRLDRWLRLRHDRHTAASFHSAFHPA